MTALMIMKTNGGGRGDDDDDDVDDDHDDDDDDVDDDDDDDNDDDDDGNDDDNGVSGCGGFAVKAELKSPVSGWFPCSKQVVAKYHLHHHGHDDHEGGS